MRGLVTAFLAVDLSMAFAVGLRISGYTGIKKTGKKIANSGWQKDPMSPKFQTNLRWGISFLQMAICLPLYEKANIPARTLPIRWVNLKRMPKPSKKASLEEIEEYDTFDVK